MLKLIQNTYIDRIEDTPEQLIFQAILSELLRMLARGFKVVNVIQPPVIEILLANMNL